MTNTNTNYNICPVFIAENQLQLRISLIFNKKNIHLWYSREIEVFNHPNKNKIRYILRIYILWLYTYSFRYINSGWEHLKAFLKSIHPLNKFSSTTFFSQRSWRCDNINFLKSLIYILSNIKFFYKEVLLHKDAIKSEIRKLFLSFYFHPFLVGFVSLFMLHIGQPC